MYYGTLKRLSVLEQHKAARGQSIFLLKRRYDVIWSIIKAESEAVQTFQNQIQGFKKTPDGCFNSKIQLWSEIESHFKNFRCGQTKTSAVNVAAIETNVEN